MCIRDSLRAVFLYGALLATLIPVVQNLIALINRTFLGAVRISYERALVGGTQSWPDNLIAIVLNLLLASYFWSILRADWSTLTDAENFKDIRRLYRFLWVLYGLLMVIFGAQQILRYIFYIPTGVIGMMGRETFINATALLVIGAPIWFFAWRILQDALADSDEKESLLRLGILYLLSLSGVIVVLTAGGNLFYMLLNRLFGEDMALSEFIQKIGGPISLGLPFGVMWAYYGKWLTLQISFEGQAPRRAGMKRIYFYILSIIGVTAAFVGLSSLFSFLIDFGIVDSSLSSEGIRQSLTSALAILVVGLPLWLMTWRPMQAEALEDGDTGDHARRSIVRKAYLYLVLFVHVCILSSSDISTIALPCCFLVFFFQAEDGIRDLVRSRGLGDVYKRQDHNIRFISPPWVERSLMASCRRPRHLPFAGSPHSPETTNDEWWLAPVSYTHLTLPTSDLV